MLDQERYAHAELLFEKAAVNNPEYGGAYSGLGQAQQEMGRLEQAESSLRRALELAPTTSRYVLLSDVLLSRDKPEEAEEALRRALELESDNEEALYNLAIIWQMEDYDRAEEVFLKLTEVAPLWSVGHGLRAQFLAYRGRAEEAEAEFRTAVASDAGDADSAFQLGRHLLAVGRTSSALKWIERAVKLDPDHTEARRLYARATDDAAS